MPKIICKELYEISRYAKEKNMYRIVCGSGGQFPKSKVFLCRQGYFMQFLAIYAHVSDVLVPIFCMVVSGSPVSYVQVWARLVYCI